LGLLDWDYWIGIIGLGLLDWDYWIGIIGLGLLGLELLGLGLGLLGLGLLGWDYWDWDYWLELGLDFYCSTCVIKGGIGRRIASTHLISITTTSSVAVPQGDRSD
jgi:hypothetical protein